MIHIPADMSASIGRGLGLETMTAHAARSKRGSVYHLATTARHLFWLLTTHIEINAALHFINFQDKTLEMDTSIIVGSQ